MKENESVLLAAYRATGAAVGEGRPITPAAEWLLDNFHLVEEQIREIREDLPPGLSPIAEARGRSVRRLSPEAAVADGTHFEIYEDNLLAEHHIRYGKTGGIAYRHIADNYIALFSRFIACGTYGATYILDALLENLSDLHPKRVHADTHGQSAAVFGLAYLLGIELMPRIRSWRKLNLYRSEHGLLRSNDPSDQEKAIVYNELVANAVVLQNVVDQTQALYALRSEGARFSNADLAYLSPYGTSNLKRFGNFPTDLIPDPVPEERGLPS